MKKFIYILLLPLIAISCGKTNREGKVDFNRKVLVRVNGEKITKKEFLLKMESMERIRVNPVPFDNLSSSAQHDFKMEVLEKIIEEKLLEQKSGQDNIAIDQIIVDARLNEMKKSLAGTLDTILEKSGKNEKDLRNDIRKGMLIEKWMDRNLVIDDAEIQQEYEQRKDALGVSEVRASHILLKTEEGGNHDSVYKEITGIHAMLLKGKSFSALAKKRSACPSASSGGNLGYIEKGSMLREFDSVAFSIETGEISPVFQTRHGYHILKVTDKRRNIPSYIESKPYIERKLKLEKLREKLVRFKKEADIAYYY